MITSPTIGIHRVVFALTFDVPSLVQFQLDPIDPEILLIIPNVVSNTATVSGWQDIRLLSVQQRDELIRAVEAIQPCDLPDLITNSRDGIAVRYRFISQAGRKGFDTTNPDAISGGAQRDWLALTLRIVREVFDDSEIAPYLAGLYRRVMS